MAWRGETEDGTCWLAIAASLKWRYLFLQALTTAIELRVPKVRSCLMEASRSATCEGRGGREMPGAVRTSRASSSCCSRRE